MANYLSAWKTFRHLGNEPAATAEHVISQPRWPSKDNLRILDVGCGDGQMAQAFLLKMLKSQTVAEVVLLDPEEGMLSEAASLIRGAGFRGDIRRELGLADKEALKLAKEIDVGLAIHVVYLLPHNRFRTFVNRWPVGIPLYVVLDAPDSVFSEIWPQTAVDYATRSRRVHEYLSGEANGGLKVHRTDFTTRMSDPFDLAPPVRDLALSLLCYGDYDEVPDGKKPIVRDAILKHKEDGFVRCACSCYELLRR